MAGLIQTGTAYRDTALKGFVRESEEQQQMDLENQKLKAERNVQQTQMGAEGAMLGGMAGFMVAGPAGAAMGAGVGFLFSKMF